MKEIFLSYFLFNYIMKKIVTSKSRPNIKGHQEKSIKIQLEMIKLGENKFLKKKEEEEEEARA
jgi:hypothetical protein